MRKNRVAVTGMSAITPFGVGIEIAWEKLIKGHSCIRQIQAFETGNLKTKIAGEILGIDYNEHLSGLDIHNLDSCTILTLLTVKGLLENKDLGLTSGELREGGIIIGTGFGTICSKEENFIRVLAESKPMFPLIIPRAMDNAPASEAAIYLGLKGINQTIFTACSSGLNAIGNAYRLIKDGYENVMIAGGVDTSITKYNLEAWSKLRVVSTRNHDPTGASRPFSKGRDGFVLSDGAGFLLLENYDKAVERQVPIYAEIIGFGATCDAQHITAPSFQEQARAIMLALKEAEITADDVDYISAHGTATKLNDVIETKAIKAALGEKAYAIPISSLKSQIGHTIGAAGAIELIFTIQMMLNNTILPTINFEERDDECDLNYVPNKAIKVGQIRYAIKNSFGFGGNNASLAIKNPRL